MTLNNLRLAGAAFCGVALLALFLTGGIGPGAAFAQSAEEAAEKSSQGAEQAEVKANGDERPKGNMTSQTPPLLGVTAGELSVLRRLADRRNALAEREAKLAEREKLVAALEVKLAEQAEDLRRLRAELAKQEEAVSATEDEKDTEAEERIKSLASAYRTMKPRDAARLFDEMEDQLLIGIAREMSPRSLAPIMSKMNPGKARALTQALTES